jgi:hypothetical protein
VEAAARGCEELSNLLQYKTRVKLFFSSLSMSYLLVSISPPVRCLIVKTAANYMIDPSPSSRKDGRCLLFCAVRIMEIASVTESDGSKRSSADYSSLSHWLRVSDSLGGVDSCPRVSSCRARAVQPVPGLIACRKGLLSAAILSARPSRGTGKILPKVRAEPVRPPFTIAGQERREVMLAQ